MANLKARIEGYVGSLVSTDTEVEDVLSAERTVLIRLLPDDLLAGNATVSTVTDGVFSRADIGTDADYRVLSVFSITSDMYARLGESHSKYGNNQSIYFADSNSPVYVVDYGVNRETRIFPAADEYRIRYLTFGGDVDISQTTVDGFDRRTLQLFVLKGCAFELSNRIQVDIADLATAFYDASGLTPPTSPIANLPAAPLLTFNAVTPTSVLATTIATVTTPIPPSSPSFTYTDAAASTISGIDLTNITDLANTLLVPSAPFFTYTDVTSSTYEEADAELDEIDNIIQDLASSSITLPILSVSYADFNTAMTNGDIELAQSYLSQIQTELSEYQAQSQTAINEFAALNARRYDSSINHAINKVDAYLKRLQDIASRADNVALQNEAKELEKQVSTYRLSLDRYTQDLNKYQADVQKLVQATQIELEQLRANAQLETDVNVQNEARTLEAQISEYQSSLNLYQAELNEHQIEVQKAITQAQLTQERLVETAQRTDNLAIQDEARRLEKEVSEYRLELEQFGAEIQTYGQELQSYGLQLQSKVSEANDKMQRKTLEIQSLTADRQYYDAMYAQELQKLGVVQANG